MSRRNFPAREDLLCISLLSLRPGFSQRNTSLCFLFEHCLAIGSFSFSLGRSSSKLVSHWNPFQRKVFLRFFSSLAQLCLAEKLAIALANKSKSLNRRAELVSKYRHENRYYLRNYPPSANQCGLEKRKRTKLVDRLNNKIPASRWPGEALRLSYRTVRKAVHARQFDFLFIESGSHTNLSKLFSVLELKTLSTKPLFLYRGRKQMHKKQVIPGD